MGGYDKQDFTQARKYFKKECTLKENMGCVVLGTFHYDRKEMEKNLKKATQYYEKRDV